MGSFITNLHVRTSEHGLVQSALDTLGREARLLGVHGAWTSLTDAAASSQDPVAIEALAAQLSAHVGKPVVAFMVHDSDVLRAWVSDGGQITGRLDTWPDWPDGEPAATVEVPATLVALCPSGGAERVQKLLDAGATFADDLLRGVATELGISADFVSEDHLSSLAERGGGDRGRGAAPNPGDMFQGLGGDGGMLAGLQEQLRAAMGPPPEASSADASALVQAADRGDLAQVRSLLEAGADPDGVAGWRPSKLASGPAAALMPEIAATPAYAAASEGHAAVLEALFEAGADPDLQIPRGDLPLSAAACAGHVDAIEAILDAGGDPAGRTAQGQTALDLLAATRQQVDQLRAMLGNMPMKLPGMPELPSEAHLDAVEALLREELADE